MIAYRAHPGNASEAARRALCTREFARRLWDGAPYKDYPWAKPIRQVLLEEEEAGRAKARDEARRQAEEADSVREKARQEHIESIAQERLMLKTARGDVLSGLVIAAELIQAMRQLTKVITKACAPKPDGSPPDISPKEAMGLLTRHATLIQKQVGAAEAVIQLSRLDRGAATVHVGLAHADELSMEQALEELEAIDETLGVARAKGLRLGP